MRANQRADELQEKQSERKRREEKSGKDQGFSEAAKLTFLRGKLLVHTGKIE
jgi:hypothetical protein